MSTKRRSLRDRNAAAIEGHGVPDADAAEAPIPASPAPPGRPPEPSRTTRTVTHPAPRKAPEPTTRVGAYLDLGLVEDSRAAYLIDWVDRVGDADTLAAWITHAIEKHLARSPRQRADAAVMTAGLSGGSNPLNKGERVTRSWALPVDVVERADRVIAADTGDGRPLTMSSLLAGAIHLAVEATKARHDGHLRPAPKVLPKRLKR